MFRRRRHHKTVETLPEVNTLRNPAQVQLAVSGVTNLQCEKVSNTQKEKDDKKCAPPISCPTASSTINVHECTTSQGVEKFTVGNSADLQAKSISTDQGSKSYTDHYISNVATAIDNERRANFVQPVMYTKRSVKARKKTSMHQKQSDQCPRDSHINRLLFGNPTDVHNGDDSYSLLANITFSSMSFPQPAAAFKYKQSQQYDSNAFIVPKQTTAYLQGRLQSAVRETSIGSTIIQDKQVDLLENSMSCLGLEYTRNLADRLTISDSRPTISSMDCSNRLLASNCPLQPYSQLSSINKCPSEPPDNANCTRQVTVVGSDKLAFGLPHDVVPPQRHRHLGRRQISRSEGDLKDVEVIFHHSSKVITNATDNIQYSKSRSPRSGSVPSCETQVNTSPHTSGDPAAKTQILAASVALNENTTKSYTMQPEESASELVIEPFPRKCIPARKCCSIVEKNTHELQPTSRTINSEGKGNVGGIRKKRIPCMVCSMPTAQRETTADELLPINEFDDIVETERRMVLDEVISTETKYLKQLLIIKEYNVAIRATNVLAEELMDIIIPECIDHLIAGHTRLLRAFETCATVDDGQPVSLIGDVFRSDASEFLKSYVYYIADLQRSIVALQQHVRDSEDFAAILADTDKEMEQNLGLASFLLTPIQRLPRYVLLLQLTNHRVSCTSATPTFNVKDPTRRLII
ncbi:hypothetical protein SARC_02443 [Sphaeroforma arctica JP610]|uniref:DH domain-containing protein n=1 Tax=Sphaeroforma arctica JP610 TaxID=667725 RepID=A0A0L0G8Z5_9EUKA|nr:hypothetical protein SARC_02443 [Sphaeroforma arctica JP610]KNC85351.1 hypothetical protein SARC_02443 [Sphaeroforma arctica JP610]|eukprot:XP_014159253.1 hypothetical protein SARC_02443 [Sphaeroforma arctica JP610]